MENAKTVLIIEDEKDLVELIRYNLENKGLRTFAAYDGEEGLRLIYEEKPDVVILDLMLPKVDGYDVLNRVKEDKTLANIPIIILSAKVSPGAIIRGFQSGAEDYIPKPFNVGELILKVTAFLEKDREVAKDT